MMAAGPVLRRAIAAAALLIALASVAGLTGVAPVHATTAIENDQRLKALTGQLRCLVCQNETLADSQADLAVDLRHQVQAMIDQGKSDAQIKQYLVDRYGDFVLYDPPVQGNTWLLWGGPFLVLLAGALIWWRVGRRSTTAGAPAARPADVPEGARLTRAQARRLLDQD